MKVLDAINQVNKPEMQDFRVEQVHYEERVSTQMNTYDCGLYTMLFMYHIVAGTPFVDMGKDQSYIEE